MKNQEKIIEELKNKIFQVDNLIEVLEMELEMAAQALNDNEGYFNLKDEYFVSYRKEGFCRHSMAMVFVSNAISEIKDIREELNEGKYRKEGDL